ncbi:restriction endonuclease subunit S [Hoeflea sp.]|uniref:restriction endonuclease subunit S n=1 Tax=Hoeflea sp. TaxID=1940281 RepID=UPI003B5217A5
MSTLSENIGGRKRLVGGPFGSKLVQSDYQDTGIPVIRGGNMEFRNRWIGGEFAYVSEEKVDRDLSTNLARPGDIIVTQRGTLGQVSIVPPYLPYRKYVISQSQMAISVDTKYADPSFVYYFLRSAGFLQYVENAAIKTGVPHINLGLLRDTPVQWPDLEAQHQIASILSALDDKIELNRRMNETLEALAQAIFKDWFVDFGPTRRKMEGAADPVAILGGLIPDPAKAEPIAALFPDSFGEDGLPGGWEIQTVQDVLELAYGKSLPTTKRTNGDVPVYGSGGVTGTHDTSLVKGPGIIIGRKGTVGSRYWEQSDFYPIDTVFFVRPIQDVPLEYVWEMLPGLALEDMNTDAAVPGLNRNNVYRLEIPKPPVPLIGAFKSLAEPLRELIEHNKKENRTLAETRDYLLPRLMSGAVRVRDVEGVL